MKSKLYYKNRCEELESLLESLYQPICDISFCQNCLDSLISQVEIGYAIGEIEAIAKSSQWFIDKLKEEK